jgi:hypothetical protein
VNQITGTWNGIDCEVHYVEMPSSSEMLEGSSVVFHFSSLEDLGFGINRKVKVIDGFCPSSVKCISGFCGYELLSEVLLSTNGQIREIEGFGECVSL